MKAITAFILIATFLVATGCQMDPMKSRSQLDREMRGPESTAAWLEATGGNSTAHCRQTAGGKHQ